MSKDNIVVQTKIQRALRSRNTQQAQRLLDLAGDTLLPLRRNTLLAELFISQHRPEKALALIRETYGDYPAPYGARIALVRAYLDLGKAQDALKLLDKALDQKKDGCETPAELQLRVRTLAALGDCDGMIAAADALSDVPRIRALVRAGALNEALCVFGAMKKGQAGVNIAVEEFVNRCLRDGKADFLLRSLPDIAPIVGCTPETVISQRCFHADTPRDKNTVIATLFEIVNLSGSARLAFHQANNLFFLGLDDAANRMLKRFQLLSERENTTIPLPCLARSSAATRPLARKIELAMEWLDIPECRQADWRAVAVQTAPVSVLHDYRLAAEPEYLNSFLEMMAPADLSLLETRARTKNPAIMATVHAGLLMGTLLYLHRHRIPIKLIGGEPVMKHLLPGGQQLDLMPVRENPVRTARKVLRTLDSGRLIGLTADGRRGVALQNVRHRGLTFQLPDSIPQLAFKRQVPIVWTVSSWRDNRVVCDCVQGPMPQRPESFEDYRQRWFNFVLNKIRGLCLADVRNIPFAHRLIGDYAL